MEPDKFTQKSQEALEAARSIAAKRSHQEIDGEHLLLALAEQNESLVPPLLQRLGVALPQLTADLERELSRRVKVQGTSSRDIYLSSDLKKVLDLAGKEAASLKDEYISAEHLLLGLVGSQSATLKKMVQ